MTKTKKILATVAALGAMTVSGFTMAAPEDAPRRGPQEAPCLERNVSPQDWAAARYESLGKMLTLTPEQEPLWKAYVDARMARFAQVDKDVKPAVDVQSRLERRAERLAARADRVKKVAQTRAALLEKLSVEQKYVLESYEFHHRRDRGDRMKDRPAPRMDRDMPMPHGMMHHPYHGYHSFGPGYDCPWR